MQERPKFLVVCEKNKKHSRTAEFILNQENLFSFRNSND